VPSSKVVWAFSEKFRIKPGNYNSDLKKISKRVVAKLFSAGFKYSNIKMPCFDTATAQSFKRLPSLTREMFNTLSFELAESSDSEMWMNLGNIFMTIGKRNLALVQYQKYLALNPASPFRGEVERQVAILEK